MNSRFVAFVAVAVFLCVIGNSCSKKNEVRTLQGGAMGTTWRLEWRGDSAPGIESAVSRTLEKWEQVLSHWRPESDLSRYNNGEPATEELQTVIELAESIGDATAGAFDFRLLKESSMAGFGPGGRGIDLSGIGKGYAVDRVGDVLLELGINDFAFELGGEVLSRGGEWTVSIEKPDTAARSIARTLVLKNQALATSGNYRQFKPVPGGLSSHILDPRTREPIIRPACSVSVIARDCATADAWATALFVLGPDVSGPASIEVSWQK
ncbi:FAD:protein FMN transferase [Luteolibacter algae]|uniref:FAD:protein FMN transferase n=1 Tax=Luteolibacter algae TaxID=454151 RepID=A0ABW5DAS9_9BACT